MNKTETEEKDSSRSEDGGSEQEVRAQKAIDENDDRPISAEDGSEVDSAVPEEVSAEQGDAEGVEEGGEDLGKALDAARAEARENYDRFLRATAELDNYRKRTAKVRIESREETLRDVLLQIAPMLDNMRRALAQENKGDDAFAQGVELIYNQFQDTLKGYGMEEIGVIGQAFDPNLHEAMMEVEHKDHPPGTVVEEVEKGYKLNNKVVRPARVVVSKAGGENG
jgi:molecular chaperone GrpE